MNCPAQDRGLQQADSVAQDNENGHRGDIADEDLPDFIPNFPLHAEFPLAGFFGHEPSGKNRDEKEKVSLLNYMERETFSFLSVGF